MLNLAAAAQAQVASSTLPGFSRESTTNPRGAYRIEVPGQPLLLPDGQRTADHFYDPDAFQAPKPYIFGNAGRNILPRPGSALVNLDLIRSFPISEAAAIEFRAESFNVFNHPNYGRPSPYSAFGAFLGKVSSTGDPRRFQFAIRFDF